MLQNQCQAHFGNNIRKTRDENQSLKTAEVLNSQIEFSKKSLTFRQLPPLTLTRLSGPWKLF